MHVNGFDPRAAYRVCNWRGFTHGTRQYWLGDRVTTSEIDAVTLFTLYRFRFVEKMPAPPAPPPQPPQQSAARESLAARLQELGKSELRVLCQSKGIDASGNEAHLRNRLLAMVG